MAGKALQRHGALRASETSPVCMWVLAMLLLSSLNYLSVHSSSLIFKIHAYEKLTRVYKKIRSVLADSQSLILTLSKLQAFALPVRDHPQTFVAFFCS